MSRTKKDTILKQQKRITTRFTETEYDTLKAKAEATHIPIATYVHDAALDRRIEIRYEFSPSMPELSAMAGSLGKTASNLNQIARYMNEGGRLTENIIDDIRQGIREIYLMRDNLESLKSSIKG